MCDCLEVSKSGYYDWHGRVPSKRNAANVTLLAQIEAAHLESDATYGMPRIRAELADQGVVASRKRIASVRPSMGTVGDAYDNAMSESFFATLERELIDRRNWNTHTEARLAIFTWIEAWYNPHRRHSSLGQRSPINFERLNIKKKEDAKTQKPASCVNNPAPAQTESSIDCDRQVNLIENTQEVKNL